MRNRRICLAIILTVLLAGSLLGCQTADSAPEVADNEILLLIQLDLKEDIGLLVVHHEADGFSGSGGTSNADKSLMKHDDLLYYSLENRDADVPSAVKDLSLQFEIVTEYVDPNYDNIYPAEYTKPMAAISLDAEFGQMYRITITGDKANGYTAVLDG